MKRFALLVATSAALTNPALAIAGQKTPRDPGYNELICNAKRSYATGYDSWQGHFEVAGGKFRIFGFDAVNSSAKVMSKTTATGITFAEPEDLHIAQAIGPGILGGRPHYQFFAYMNVTARQVPERVTVTVTQGSEVLASEAFAVGKTGDYSGETTLDVQFDTDLGKVKGLLSVTIEGDGTRLAGLQFDGRPLAKTAAWRNKLIADVLKTKVNPARLPAGCGAYE